MQDDNLNKKLGDLLRQHQEQDPLPYEEGAWESFDRMRKPKVVPFWYWTGGIAASLLLIWAVGSLMWSENLDTSLESTELISERLTEKLSTESSPSTEQTNSLPESTLEESTDSVLNPEKNLKSTSQASSNSINKSIDKDAKKETISQAITGNLALQSENQDSKKLENDLNPPQSNQVDKEQNGLGTTAYLSEEEAKAKLQAQLDAELPSTAAKSVEEKPNARTLALGFGPGFGSSGGQESTSGSSLGLGVLFGLDISDKITVSSGLGVNYFNQASESQRYAQMAGFASAVTETREVSQVQVDVPLYITYPVTSNGGISVQAGFSNLVTFNQNSAQQSEYTFATTVADFESSFANAIRTQSSSVSQVSDLEVPNSRFYPFATANLGVNIRIMKRENTSYAIMPFYNYPIQEISGYGERLGFYGASFKIQFGTSPKK